MSAQPHLYPADKAHKLDSKLRFWLQNPYKLLSPYINPGDQTLDFGCGSGYFTLAMARLAGPSGQVYAVDIQEAMLRQTEQKFTGATDHARLTLVQSDQYAQTFTQPVNFALAAYVIHETKDPLQVFADIYRRLKPGGHFLYMEPDFIVSRKQFNAFLEQARQAGFSHISPLRLLLSKAVLMKKV